jgi:hypothetical protein
VSQLIAFFQEQKLEAISRRDTWLQFKTRRISIGEVTRRFEEWCARDISLVFSHEGKVYERLAAKRGNRIYTWSLRTQLSGIAQSLKERIHVTRSTTNAVFVTLTDPQTGSPALSWESIGKRWNLFLQNIRKGHKILYMRAWESTQTGFPHVHAIIIFQDKTFSTFLKWSKTKRRMMTRVHGSREWRRYWNGFIDVQGVETTQGAAWYITKEILKYEAELPKAGDTKGRQTLALLWASGRRSFSLSQELSRGCRHEAPGRLDGPTESKSNSNRLEKEVGGVGVLGLERSSVDLESWKLLGICPRADALEMKSPGQKDGLWAYELLTVPSTTVELNSPLRSLDLGENEHELIIRGGRKMDPSWEKIGGLDVWVEDEPDVYDEVASKYRRRITWEWNDELKCDVKTENW